MNLRIRWIAKSMLFTCLLIACQEESLLVNSNDTAYLRFTKDMTKDTTTVSFKMYNEGEDALIPLEVSVTGQIQQDDLHFNVCVDKEKTTLPESLIELPAECVIRKGYLIDTIYVTLKNDAILKNETKLLVLQFVEREGVKRGDYLYSKANIAVTDRLFKPDWWSVNDLGSEAQPENSVETFFLGSYSETKYLLFLNLLKEDGVVFDGKDKQVLRKYALKLKNYLKDVNGDKPESEWAKDEFGEIMRVPVAG